MDGASYYLSAHFFVEHIPPYMGLLSTGNVAYVRQGKGLVEIENRFENKSITCVVERIRRLVYIYFGRTDSLRCQRRLAVCL